MEILLIPSTAQVMAFCQRGSPVILKSKIAGLILNPLSNAQKTGFSEKRLFGLCYAMNGGYRGCNPCIERHLAIFVNYFCLERTNQLSLLPDKDLVDLCSPIEPYQVTKSRRNPFSTHAKGKKGNK